MSAILYAQPYTDVIALLNARVEFCITEKSMEKLECVENILTLDLTANVQDSILPDLDGETLTLDSRELASRKRRCYVTRRDTSETSSEDDFEVSKRVLLWRFILINSLLVCELHASCLLISASRCLLYNP